MYCQFQTNRRRVKYQARDFDFKRGFSIDRQAVFVWSGGSWSKLQHFLSEGIKMVPFDGAHIVIKNTLQDAIDTCVEGDVIVICPGEHILHDTGDLNTCLNIFGVGENKKNKLILDCGYDYEILVDGSGSILNFENLTVSSKIKQNGILVKNGAKAVFQQCIMTNFKQTIEVRNQSSCFMKWSEVSYCVSAISVEENGHFESTGGLIENCEVGIITTDDNLSNIILDDTDNYALTPKGKQILTPRKKNYF